MNALAMWWNMMIYNGENTDKIEMAISESLGDEVPSSDIVSNPVESFNALYDYLYDDNGNLIEENVDTLLEVIDSAKK